MPRENWLGKRWVGLTPHYRAHRVRDVMTKLNVGQSYVCRYQRPTLHQRLNGALGLWAGVRVWVVMKQISHQHHNCALRLQRKRQTLSHRPSNAPAVHYVRPWALVHRWDVDASVGKRLTFLPYASCTVMALDYFTHHHRPKSHAC